jgi:hypothetical protein
MARENLDIEDNQNASNQRPSKLKNWISPALCGLIWITCYIGKLILKVFVSPYRRMLQIYTLDPIASIEKCSDDDIEKMIKLVQTWRKETKKEELKGVRVAVS